jgi:HEAT repeat protein
MANPVLEEKINKLLRTLESKEPLIHELGTPRPVESDEIDQLVALDRQAVPYLLDLMRVENPKLVAYIASILGRIGDIRAIGPLRELLVGLKSKDPKTPWDYAAIGQSQQALKALEESEAK